MSSKKYTLLLGLLALAFSSVTAQVTPTGGYDWRDSSLIPASRVPQQNEFMNNQYYYPAKPRNQWEIGVKVGNFFVAGDVPSLFPNIGFGAHVRKSFGYLFSLRLEYMFGIGRGLHYQPATNYRKNPAWEGNGYAGDRVSSTGDRIPTTQKIYYNYKSKVQDLGLQGVFSLNNIRFHKANTNVQFYLFAGAGLTWYDTKINALNASGQAYVFPALSDAYKDKRDTRKALKDLMDDTYETDAENYGNTRAKLFGNTVKGSGTVGVGVAFKVNKRINIAIEDRHTFISDDLLDGQRWQEQPLGDATLTRSFDSYNFMSVGINFNIGAKAVEPLYWLNPLEFAYSELNAPKRMKMPKPVLDDADGDGITDQFDNEPNTPAGAPVDSHGVSKDTDGDGVPDYKDKQLITPTECQPVDADGVGKCPDPACCTDLMGKLDKLNECNIGDLPSLSFKGNSSKISKDAEAVLATVAERMRNNPKCKVVVSGYGEPSKSSQQLSWDRVNSIINFMVDKQGISSDRFVFKYGLTEGDPNTVDLRAAGEGDEGPNTVPAPHPNLRRR
ncbi:OmpA family protein [Pollutibacter soli]|uniref:OmpA family protein n=1 Tax=Pollutibacter soli TaxID=3034157 RepID=UPI0030136FA6